MTKKTICKNVSRIYVLDSHASFYNTNPEEYSIYFVTSEQAYEVVQNKIAFLKSDEYLQMFLYSKNRNNVLEYASWAINPEVKLLTTKDLEKIVESINSHKYKVNILSSKKEITLLYHSILEFQNIWLTDIEYAVFKKACYDVPEKGKNAGTLLLPKKNTLDYYIFMNLNDLGLYDYYPASGKLELSKNGINFYNYLLTIN
jgi:hypothetical protein